MNIQILMYFPLAFLIFWNQGRVLCQSLHVTKLTSNDAIVLDGKLDEPLWNRASFSYENLKSSYGHQDNLPINVFMAFDDDFLYVAAIKKALTKEPIELMKLPKDNEAILNNEWFGVSIDSYSDGITAYTFIVDTFGNQFDGTLNASRDLSNSFSADWVAASHISINDFSFELKIPLHHLPFQKQLNPQIGVSFFYHDKKSGQLIQFPTIEQQGENQIEQYIPFLLKPLELSASNRNSLSGIDITKRLEFKKEKNVDMSTLKGRAQGGDASIMDYYLFKKRSIPASDLPKQVVPYSLDMKAHVSQTFMESDFIQTFYSRATGFDAFLERSQTTAFIVFHKDHILFEQYYNGFTKDSIVTSFSMSKSVTSILIGIAIEQEYINTINQKITDFIPELSDKDPAFHQVTIKDLLSMRSGIRYDDQGFPSDDDYTYIAPDLRNTTLEQIQLVEKPNTQWKYNNYNLILLGMILERATGQKVTDFTKKYLWDYIGTSDASWSLDERDFEKMESGFNAIPLDYARLGLLMLHEGNVMERNLLSSDWITGATQPNLNYEEIPEFFLANNLYYSFLWWGKKRMGTKADFFAMGNKGEYIYIIPSKELVIVRLGMEYGLFTPGSLSWPTMFFEFGNTFSLPTH